MVRERKTKLAERVISLLLAIVMTVSGTGLTAFASEFGPEDTEAPAVTEEAAGPEEPEESDLPGDRAEEPDLPEDESGEPEEPAEPENSDAVSAEPETPAQDPEVTEASDLPEEPKNPDTQPEEPQEPEQPDPVFKPLDLELKTEERITYTFVTEDEVIPAELTPAARLWGEEDYEQFEEFTDDLPEDQQIVQAFVIGDGTEQEIPVVFTETAEVFLSCDQWDWSDLTGAEVKEHYTLYLSDTQGNLKPATFDVLLAEDEHNDHGDALVFDAAQLSVLVLAETVSVEEEVHDALVEVSASDSEPLLAEGELTAASRTALRSRQAPQQVAPSQQQPVSQDGTTIEKITVRWISNSTGSSAPAGFDRLVMVPENDRVPNQQFQIDFALSGKDDYEPGTIELIFPAYIWLDRNDKEPGVLTLSVPQDPENRTEFAWRREGDNIVITNTRRLSAASKVLIQGTYRNMEAHSIRDIDTADQSLPYRGVSDPFYATVNVVTTNDNVLTMTSNQIDASLDTHTQVTAATKTARNTMTNEYYLYYDIPGSLPADLRPEDPEDYLYIRWYVSGKAVGNQPYVMTVTDTAENAYGCVMLGAEADGKVVKAENGTVTAVLYNGYSDTVKAGYIWTAYPKSALPEDGTVVQLNNTQTITVTGVDDNVSTTMTASASVPAKSPAVYHFIKEWDDENDRRGLRPDYLYLDIYDDSVSSYYPWRTVAVYPDENDIWSYTWTDEGQARQFRIRERLVNASGTYGSYYDIYGNLHSMRWNYLLKSTDYDASTRTWTYVNQYSEGWIKYDVSSFSKRAEYKYSDSALKSTRDRALNDLLKGQEVEVQFTASGRIAPALWTVHYGQKPVTVGVIDDVFRLNGVQLSTEDVAMSAVRLRVPGVLSYQNYDDTTGFYESVPVTESQTVRLYAYRSGQWEQIATMTGSDITVTPNSGASYDGYRIDLPEGVTQVKTEMETDQAIVDVSMDIFLCVKPTDRVLSAIESAFEDSDYVRFDLQNEAEAYGTYNGEKIITMRQPATAFLHGRQYKVAVDLQKNFYYVDNDLVERRLKLHTTADLILQSNVLDQDVYLKGLADGDIPNTQSGTFYDLLPIGVQPDTSSIRLNGGDNVKAAYTVENYLSSGRTLLVVQADLSDHISYKYYNPYNPDTRHSGAFPTEGYRNTHTIDFDSYYSWDDAQKYGLEGLRNTIAYEADEEVLANIKTWAGEPDDPTAGLNILSDEVGTDAELFTGLDGGRTDPAFAYGGAILRIDNVDIRALTSLQKHVTADGSGRWSYGLSGDEVSVQEGGRYTYRLYVQSDTDTWTRDIIITDSIENYVPTEESADYGDTQWRGTFLSVDVSQLVASGVAPVVYYSTVPNLDLSYGVENQLVEEGAIRSHIENDTMNGAKVWSTTPPADLSQVTAIAIDASKCADGTDFILKDNEILMAYVHMIAPSGDATNGIFVGDGKDATQNAHAYNNAHLAATQITFGVETNAYITNNYTKLGIFTRAFDVTKVWDDENDNDGLRPDSVTVHLFADGEDTGLTLTLDESNDWHGTFDHLKTFNEDGSYIIYTFTEDEVEDYTLRINRAGDKITLTNHHDLIQTEVPVAKVWKDDAAVADRVRPEAITVRLLADGVFTGKILTVRPDNSGNWSGLFTNVNKYSQGHEIVYTLEEVPVTDYRTTYDDGAHVIFNSYYPYGDLIISKTVTGVTPVSAQVDFTFTLELTDSEGNELIDRYAYVTSGGRTGTLGNGDEFTLKGGETITVKDIPSHALYKVTERPSDGFTITSAQNTEGVINAHNPAEVSFTNDYAASGSLQLSLTKTLTGRPAMSQYQFRFQVTDEEGNILRTASSKSVGTAVFGGIPYTQADHDTEFTYYVSEIDRQKPGYTYDTDVITVKVTPVDNGDGTMTCEPQFFDAEGNELTEIAFQNEYHAEGEITLRAWKTLLGRDLTEGEFSFRLMTPDGAEIETVQNNDKGEIAWTALHFDQDDVGETFLYIAEELPGTDPTVTYDESVKGYELTVLDNDNGTLSIVQTNVNVAALTEEQTCDTCSGTGLVGDEDCPDCEGTGHITIVTGYEKADGEAGLPVFTNTLKPGALSVTKLTTWDPGVTPDESQIFHFQVRLIGDEVAEDAQISYELEQVENVGEGGNASNPTTVRSTPTGGTNIAAGVFDGGEVEWLIDIEGTLIIRPTNGERGEFNGPRWSGDWPWYQYRTYIRQVVVRGNVIVHSYTSHMFGGYYSSPYPNLTTVDLRGLDTSDVTDMWWMFGGCSNLTELDVSELDTSNVHNMGNMFYDCSRLENLDVSNFDVSSCDDSSGNCGMFQMFMNCSSLKSLDLRGWDTSNVRVMDQMFANCSSLKRIEIDKLDFENSHGPYKMFSGCSSLETLNAKGFINTGNIMDMCNMFEGCSSLTTLDVSDWDTSGCWGMTNMFYGCSSLTSLDLSSWDTSKCGAVTWHSMDMRGMFSGCTSLSSIALGPNFKFDGRGISDVEKWALFPEAPDDDPYTGFWTLQGHPEIACTAEELRDTYDASLAGTWVWQTAGFTINYAAPDGAGGSMAVQRMQPGETAALNPNTFYLFDHTFLGWDADGDGVADYEDGAEFTAGDVNEGITLTAVFEKNDHTVTLSDGTFDLYLHGGEKATIPDLPAGTAYQVWEETPAGWVLLTQENASGNIEPLTTAEAIFTNRYQPGTATAQIVGSKTLNGRAAAEGAFSFQLLEGTRVLQTVSNVGGGFIRFDAIGYTVADLGEHTYTVREVRGTDSAIDYDTHTETVTVTVSGDADNLTAAVTYDSDGVKFANTTRPGSLEITKIGEGVTDANADTEFSFRVRLTNQSGMPLGDGESYNWYVKGETQSSSNPTTGRSNPTTSGGLNIEPEDGATITASGTRDNITWELYSDKTLVIRPTPGTDGTFYGNTGTQPKFWPWHGQLYQNVDQVVIRDGCKLIGSAYGMFTYSDNYGWHRSNVKKIDMKGLDTSQVTNMARMFYDSWYLTAIDMTGLDTSNVEDMSWMFASCGQSYGDPLMIYGTGSWDTSKVKSMEYMFSSCKVGELDVSNWDTGNVTTMNAMFYNCHRVQELDVSKWNTHNVTNMHSMFCGNFYNPMTLTALDVSNWDTSNVTDMYQMFYDCRALEVLDVSNWDTGKVTSEMDEMFYNCNKLTELDLSSWDTSHITNMSGMFSGCSSLETLNVSNLDTGNVTNISNMFLGCSSVTELNVSSFDTENVTNMAGMFSGCSSLTELDLSGFDTENVTNMNGMFSGCSSLTELDLSGFDTSDVTNMYGVFSGCSSLKRLNLSGWDTANVTDISYIFSDCSSLEELNLSGWDVRNVSNMGGMFSNCSGLKKLNLSGWNFEKATSTSYMFQNCSSLTELDLSGWATDHVTNMSNMFQNCSSLTELDLSDLDTGSVTNMSYMFSGCRNLKTLDLSAWNTANLVNTEYMFNNCASLEYLDLSNFDTQQCDAQWAYPYGPPPYQYGGMRNMFTGCSSLSRIDLGTEFRFNGSGIEKDEFKALLPTSPTGEWMLEQLPELHLTEQALRDAYDANAGTYAGTWVWYVPDDTYLVNFDANGGYTSAGSVTVTADNPTFTLPDEDTTARPDHKLTGWNTAADGSGTGYGVGETVSEIAEYGKTITLYAQWEEGTPNVKYKVQHYQQNTDFETYSLTETDVLRAESGSTQTPAVKTYPGFKAPDAQTVTVAAGGTTVVRYYYDRTRYTIAFDANTGEGAMDALDMVGGIGEALPANKFTKQDALFTGWNTVADGSGTSYGDGQTVNSIGGDGETVTLYAQWLESGIETAAPTNGEFIVTAKAGQTIVIPGLPAGTQYEIEEIDVPGGWTKTADSNLTGSVAANTGAAASVTNRYEAKGYATVTAHKQLEGGVLTTDRFTFELLSSDGAVIGVSTNGPVDTVTQTTEDDGSAAPNPWYGTAPVYFDAIEFTQPGTYTYSIREQAGSDPAVNYDAHEETVTIQVTDNGDGTLSADVQYDADGALFTNSMKTGSLTVSKTVKNGTAAALEQTFTFTVDLKDSDGNALGGTYPVTKSDGTETTVLSGGTVSMKAGETFTVSDLPHGCLYTITEQDKAGFELTDSSGASGQIDATQAGQNAAFENTYSTSGSVTLTAHKTLEGGTIGAEQFQFRLTDADGNELSVAYADTDGTITFTPLDYSQSDDGKTFTYFITEVEGEDETIRYDTHTEEVTVTVSDNGNGTMTADVTYSDGAEFTNVQLYRLTVRKTVAGNMGDTTEKFPFTLKLARNGAAYSDTVDAPEGVNWTAGESGEYTFTLSHGDSFTILLPADVTYEITETAPEDYKVSISITTADGSELANAGAAPAAKGTISQEVGDQIVSFTNTREAAVPTGTGMPALPAIIGMSTAALAGLGILYSKKRRRKTA